MTKQNLFVVAIAVAFTAVGFVASFTFQGCQEHRNLMRWASAFQAERAQMQAAKRWPVAGSTATTVTASTTTTTVPVVP